MGSGCAVVSLPAVPAITGVPIIANATINAPPMPMPMILCVRRPPRGTGGRWLDMSIASTEQLPASSIGTRPARIGQHLLPQG
jgi:hypothetical protein